MMKKRSHLIVLFTILALALSACSVTIFHGSGNIITETRVITDFHGVDLTALGDLSIQQGEKDELRIQADDNLMHHIISEVHDGILTISFDDNKWSNFYTSSESIKFYLTVKDLDAIQFSGAGKITVEDVSSPTLSVSLNGVGSIYIENVTADSLNINLSGAGDLSVDGIVTNQNINLSGVGSYHAADLDSQSATITLSGAGSATIWVEDSLDVHISGIGSVGYFGDPHVIKSISGLGSLIEKGTK
jgi:predicted small secreted protein